MYFSERLRELRKKSGLTQLQLAHAINTNERTCRRYESGDIEPTLHVLIALADYFDVSLDYLVGRKDTQ